MLCFVTLRASASTRTKNRLREHGQVFYLVREDTVPCFLGQRAALLESEQTLWRGWLPLDEIELDFNQGNWPVFGQN